jgi:hypothetical protein
MQQHPGNKYQRWCPGDHHSEKERFQNAHHDTSERCPPGGTILFSADFVDRLWRKCGVAHQVPSFTKIISTDGAAQKRPYHVADLWMRQPGAEKAAGSWLPTGFRWTARVRCSRGSESRHPTTESWLPARVRLVFRRQTAQEPSEQYERWCPRHHHAQEKSL